MRDLRRNHRPIWYAAPTGSEPIKDEYGNDTLEVKTLYQSPVSLSVNIGTNGGADVIQAFGSITNYSRTVSVTGHCPLTEGCLVWFGVEPDKPANYSVVAVADSKNVTLVALREVASRV